MEYMEIKGKIEKVSFISGNFNSLKEDIPKSIEKEGWTNILHSQNSILIKWKENNQMET